MRMTPKKLKERKERILKLNRALKKLFPKAEIELHFGSPLELLIAVQLSAQCTDKMVNKITQMLFKKYKKLDDYTEVKPREFERDIRSSGFYRNKTKNILASARIIKEDCRGQIPKTMEELLRLPGVGRKTANVVLIEAYGVVVGIPVDTHVIRFVQRFDLSDYKDPVKIEKDLMKLLPKREWKKFTHRVIQYGRHMRRQKNQNLIYYGDGIRF